MSHHPEDSLEITGVVDVVYDSSGSGNTGFIEISGDEGGGGGGNDGARGGSGNNNNNNSNSNSMNSMNSGMEDARTLLEMTTEEDFAFLRSGTSAFEDEDNITITDDTLFGITQTGTQLMIMQQQQQLQQQLQLQQQQQTNLNHGNSNKRKRLSLDIIEEKDKQIQLVHSRIEELEHALTEEQKRASEFRLLYENEKIARKNATAPSGSLHFSESSSSLTAPSIVLENLEKQQHQHQQQKQQQLEQHTQKLQEQLQSARDQIELLRQSRDRERQEKEMMIDTLRRERDDLSQRLKSSEIMLESSTEKVRMLEDMLSSINQKSKISQDKQHLLDHTIDTLTESLRQSEHKIKSLETQLESVNDREIVLKQLHSEVARLQNMETQFKRLQIEHRTLSEHVQNSDLLKEEVRSLQVRLSEHEQVVNKLADTSAACEILQRQLEDWRSFIPAASGSVAEAAKIVSSLQHENAVLTQKLGLLTNEKNLAESNEKKALEKVLSLERDVQNLKAELFAAQSAVEVHRRNETILRGDREGLQTLFNMYELEVAPRIESEQNESIRPIDFGQIQAEVNRLRLQISQQESAVKSRDAELCILQESLRNSQSETAMAQKRAEECQFEHNKSKQEFEMRERGMQADIERLQKELEVAEKRLGRGEFNKQTTKVLHMSINPETLKRADQEKNDMENLQAENRVLQAKVEQLEQSGGVNNDLRRKVADLEKTNLRLKEVFAKMSGELRQVCFLLFGWHLDMEEKGKWRLSCMYLDSPDDHFLFQFKDGGSMEMLATEYCLRIEDQIKTHLDKYKCIPALLSHLLMQKFSQQSE